MKEYLIYLAGPIAGKSYDESEMWRNYVISQLDLNIHGLSPLRKKHYLKDVGKLDGTFDNWPLSNQRGIFARDKFDCHRADLVLVNLQNAEKVSIGTCMEIAWASQANIPIVLIMPRGNVHEHPMILEACPFVVDDLDEAVALVHAILSPDAN